MSKRIGLLLVLVLTASGLVQITSAHGAISKPSVPEFTVELTDSSYDIPPSTSVDPYTGQPVTQAGRHVEARTIELSIKNQPFTPFQVEDERGNNWTVDFQYNIRYRGHFEQDWTEMFLISDGYPHQDHESDYTVFSYQGEYSATEGLEFKAGSIMTRFPLDAQVDFQVEAMIGYVNRGGPVIAVPGSGWTFTGETSGWSSTQTLAISDDQTPSTTILDAVIIAIAVLVTTLVAAGILVYFKRRRHEVEPP